MDQSEKHSLRALFLRGYELGLAMRAPRSGDGQAPEFNQGEIRSALEIAVGSCPGNEHVVLTVASSSVMLSS